MLKLEALKRDTKEDLENMRQMGIIPAVFYGPKEESTPIKIESVKFDKVFDEAGESTIVELDFEGKAHDVLIHAVDRHPVKDTVNHVDFYVVEKGKKVNVHVPIEFEGESKGEKTGGILVKVMHELEIEAMPKDLPHEIKVDISVLEKVGDQILAGDIKMPEGVELLAETEDVVAVIQEAKEENFDEPVEGPDMDSIEVAKEKKTEEEPTEE